MKYMVYFAVDAGFSVSVEAGSEEQAEQLAWEKADTPRICSCCSQKLDLGDIQKVTEVTAV